MRSDFISEWKLAPAVDRLNIYCIYLAEVSVLQRENYKIRKNFYKEKTNIETYLVEQIGLLKKLADETPVLQNSKARVNFKTALEHQNKLNWGRWRTPLEIITWDLHYQSLLQISEKL